MVKRSARSVPRPGDIVVFGAPGSALDGGRLVLSEAAVERARLAAEYWTSLGEDAGPVRVICVAGRPKYRQGMDALPEGQSEAWEIAKILTDEGVLAAAIRPGPGFPLSRDFAVSTVDEVAVLVEEGLATPRSYSAERPLVLVLHRRHGARAMLLMKKAGFAADELVLLAPEKADTRWETVLRWAYRAAVARGRGPVPVEVLRAREERLIRIRMRVADRIRARKRRL